MVCGALGPRVNVVSVSLKLVSVQLLQVSVALHSKSLNLPSQLSHVPFGGPQSMRHVWLALSQHFSLLHADLLIWSWYAF